MDLVITILILIAVQLVLFFVLKGRIDQELNASKLLKQVQDEVEEMVRELNLSAERNIGLLEARISEMEALVEKADQKVLLLAKETERRDRAAEVYSHLRKVSVPEPEPAAEPPVAVTSPEPIRAAETPLTLKDRVLAGFRQGWDSGEIARQTGVTRAEVELILSLNLP